MGKASWNLSHLIYRVVLIIYFCLVYRVEALGDFPGGPVVTTSPSNTGGAGSIPGREAKIPQALQPKSQNIKQKQYCNKFNKDFKKDPHQKIFKKKINNRSSA